MYATTKSTLPRQTKPRSEMGNSPPVRIYRNHMANLAPRSQKVMRKLVGALVDLAVRKRPLGRPRAPRLNHALAVRELLRVGRKDLVDGLVASAR